MAHHHSHDHTRGGHASDHPSHRHRHEHAHAHDRADERRMLWTLLLTGGFMVAEVFGGILAGSLALLADAAHMLADAAALGLAWLAIRLARRPPDLRRSFGYHRLQVLAAFVNGAGLIVIAAWIVIEAVHRLLEPVEVLGGSMLVVALLGLAVNLVAFAILHGGNRQNMNLRGALLHVISDLLGSAAAIAAAGVILLTGWSPIDPILSALMAALILRGAWDLVRGASHVLLEGTPEGFDAEELRRDLVAAVPGIENIHHVHVWALTPERPLVTLHARIAEGLDHDVALRSLQSRLEQRYGLQHATIQVERGDCASGASVGGCDAAARRPSGA